MDVEKWIKKAEERLDNSGSQSSVKAYQGIGFALLAIAVALDNLSTVLHNKGD